MIGELLLQTDLILPQPAAVLDALVIGAGPSYSEGIRRLLPAGLRYGCGAVTRWIEVDHYLLGDVIHVAHVPADKPVSATLRVIAQLPDARRFHVFPEDTLPHGGSSGGMALSLACQNHEVVGLLGFDGYGVDDEFVAAFRRLILYWQARGKRLLSLMPDSAFHDVLERFEWSNAVPPHTKCALES